MGEVWRAEHTSLGAPVAIKLIDVELLGSGSHDKNEIIQRFFREAKAAAALRSPHVVQILDHGYDGPLPYIAMELLEGETLEQRLERDKKLSPLHTAEVITHIARAIGKAHEAGIVHRDLKPSNVFLVRNDDEEIAKVLDFGIAKATGGGVLGSTGGVSTRTGSVVGTPCYMSPEQALGNKTIDHRADLWALGVIAFECVCGQRPFDSEALGDLIVQICARPLPVPSAVAPVPDGFDVWFAKACARDPGERFQSAKELAESLRWILAPDTTAMRRLGQTHPSIPNIPVPAPPQEAKANAYAKTAAVDPTTMTHRGLVSAVAPPPAPSKKVRPAVIAGVAAALVVGGATILLLSRSTGSPSTNALPPDQATQAPTAAPPPTLTAAQTAAPTAETTAEPPPTAEPTATHSATATSASGPSAVPPNTTSKGSGGTKTKSGSTTTKKTTKDRIGL
jgi:serine/threonine-protein kinase